MRASGLIDTGAIIALVDAGDRWHRACVQAFETQRLPLMTTESVLTEVFHIISRREAESAWRFIRSGAILLGLMGGPDLAHLEALMLQYRDRPMDFADATLVRLADREALSTIFTIDHDDFETYRIRGRRRFQITPLRGSLR